MDDQSDGRVDIRASAFAGQILGADDDVTLVRLQDNEQNRAVHGDFASRRAASCVGQGMPYAYGATICEGKCRFKKR